MGATGWEEKYEGTAGEEEGDESNTKKQRTERRSEKM